MSDFGIVFTTDRDCPTCDNPFNILTTEIGNGHTLTCGMNGHTFPARHKDDPDGGDEIRFEYHFVGGDSSDDSADAE